MCGINGWFSRVPIPLDRTFAMADVVRHRGPDGEGYAHYDLVSKVLCTRDRHGQLPQTLGVETASTHGVQAGLISAHVGLGHRRLAIVDLTDGGRQPMCSSDGRYWIVFNGEIYNYLEIRAELSVLGHVFRTGSDTEVLLASFEEWGEQCLNRLNGMWAFAILDRQGKSLFLARDRFGVKPFYYWIAPSGVFHFASEIKQFTVCPEWTPRFNAARVADFLVLDMQDHTDETMFSGVFQLPAGSCCQVALSGVPCVAGARVPAQRWYTPTTEPFAGGFSDACEQFGELLESAVVLRLRADVDVGSCLSGGLDSSAIVCLASRHRAKSVSEKQQHTFSIYSDRPGYDERSWIGDVLATSGALGTSSKVDSNSMFEALGRVTWQQDEPFGSSGICAQSAVFQLAAQAKCKVLLDGQGADELLGGYHSFFAASHGRLLASGRVLELASEMRAARRHHGFGYLAMLTRAVYAACPDRVRSWAHRNVRGAPSNYPFLNDDLLYGAASTSAVAKYGRFSRSPRALSHDQVTRTSLPRLLHFEDRNSMSWSVEARLPFLDYRVAEFAMSIAEEHKLRNGTTKMVLRESMRGIIPNSVADRQGKLGFATGEPTWARSVGANQFRERLRIAVDCGRGVIRPSVLPLFERIASGNAPYGAHIWRVVSFGEWCRLFFPRGG